MNGTTELTCPKCGAEMRSYERNGVTVDQCTGCRGVFLDRGELERLIDAEGSYYEREREPERERHEEKHGGQKPKKSKKRSFLENVLEGIGE
jgi:Zn-finger nucleic acid-binding protein